MSLANPQGSEPLFDVTEVRSKARRPQRDPRHRATGGTPVLPGS